MNTKDLFVLAMNELKTSYDFERNLSKTIRESFKGTLIDADFIDSDSYIIDHHELVIKLLEHITNCYDDIISWWMYEADFGRRDDKFKTITYEDGREVVLNTAEDLYRYIVDES